jgi:hypothetical protein
MTVAAGNGVRGDLEAAILADVARAGLDRLDRAAVVRRFLGRGASERTLYRWVAAVIDSGRAAQHLSDHLAATAAAHAAHGGAGAAAPGMGTDGAAVPGIASTPALMGNSPAGLVVLLQDALACSTQVMRHARDADGKVRNAKLLLSAAGTLARCLDTAMRLQASIQNSAALDAFHEAVMTEIRAESPVTAERIVRRLQRFYAERHSAAA